mmetsp:Transcript_18907/g.54225  ORF Transcript_18907/g.54225 Transcript_18907/m.54225 type:complete len:81 (+) Transcript_18907:353-595(+)
MDGRQAGRCSLPAERRLSAEKGDLGGCKSRFVSRVRWCVTTVSIALHDKGELFWLVSWRGAGLINFGGFSWLAMDGALLC